MKSFSRYLLNIASSSGAEVGLNSTSAAHPLVRPSRKEVDGCTLPEGGRCGKRSAAREGLRWRSFAASTHVEQWLLGIRHYVERQGLRKSIRR